MKIGDYFMSKNHEERRHYARINKNFILSFYLKNDPSKKHEITQLKNISMGGMCFITTSAYERKSKIAVELRTPYISETTHMEGVVLASHEKVKNMIYETRLQFEFLESQAEFLLTKLIDIFKQGEADE